MNVVFGSIILGLALLTGSAAAQTEKKPTGNEAPPVAPRESPATGGGRVEVRYEDRSVVRMTVVDEKIVLLTKYGPLTIPVPDVERIVFGLRITPEEQMRIDQLIKGLGHDQFPQREKSSNQLLALGAKALPALRLAKGSKDAEVANRAKQLLGRLAEMLTEEELQVRDNDLVQTLEFTITGRVTSAGIKARSPYFGDVTLRTEQIREIRWLGVGRLMQIVVDAAKYADPRAAVWLDTGVEVEAGVLLAVTASGSVDMYPRGVEAGRYVSDPDGRDEVDGRTGKERPGLLLGRIGASGPTFKIGKSLRTTSPKSGRLFLRIGASPWDNQCSGAYKVKINVRG